MKGLLIKSANMRALIERVSNAKCIINQETHSEIGNGLLVYIAYEAGDDFDKIIRMCEKISKLRIFTDEKGKLNLSVKDVSGSCLLISSFSLFADLKTGNRPSFSRSIPFNESEPLYEMTKREMASLLPTCFGIFGADMKIEATNDGPVSVILDM